MVSSPGYTSVFKVFVANGYSLWCPNQDTPLYSRYVNPVVTLYLGTRVIGECILHQTASIKFWSYKAEGYFGSSDFARAVGEMSPVEHRGMNPDNMMGGSNG